MEESEADDFPPPADWNNEESWVKYLEALMPEVQAIAAKYTTDHALAEDAVQNAMIELMLLRPEEIRGFEDYTSGTIGENRWQEILSSFCLTVARNEILSTLSSHTTGNLYIGRTQARRVTESDGSSKRIKNHTPARYVSLDQLIEEAGLQVSEFGELSWDSVHEVGYGDEDS